MARPESDDPRKHTVCVRLTQNEKDRLDKARGRRPASEFLRRRLFSGEDAV